MLQPQPEPPTPDDVFAHAFAVAADAMAISTLDEGRFIHVNDAFCELLGRSRAELIGHTALELDLWLEPEDRDRLTSALREQGSTPVMETKFRAGSGEIRTASFTAVLVDAPDPAILAIVRDASERDRFDKALMESEERYRTVAELTSDFAFSILVDENLVFEGEWITRKLGGILGYEGVDESEAANWIQYVFPEDIERSVEGVRRSLAGELVTNEIRMIAANGDTRWFRFRTKATFDESIKKYRLTGAGRDITDERRQDDALREAERRYRTLVERVPAVTYTWSSADEVGKASAPYISPQVETLLGYLPDEWQGDPGIWIRRVNDKDRDWVMKEWHFAQRTKTPFRAEYRIWTKDDVEIWVRDECNQVGFDDAGNPQWQGVMFDVTDRKVADQALVESENKFRTLVEQIPAITFIEKWLGAEGPFAGNPLLYVSPQASDIWGIRAEDLLDRPEIWRESIHSEDADRMFQADVESARSSTPLIEDYRLVRPDGRVVWIHEDTRLVLTPEGKPFCWLGLMFDISESKRVEQELRDYARRLTTLHEIDRAILAARSHEEIAENALRHIRALVGCERASLVEFDFDQGRVIGLAVDTAETTELTAQALNRPIDDLDPLMDGLRSGETSIVDAAERVMWRAGAHIRETERPEFLEILTNEGMRSSLGVPLMAQGDLVGSLSLMSTRPEFFTAEHGAIAREVADQLAVAIRQARLHDRERSAHAMLEERNRERETFLDRLEQAQEAERLRVSQELHDSLGQTLTSIGLYAKTIESLATDEMLPQVRELSAIVESAIADARQLAWSLRPPELDTLGLVAAIRQLAGEISERAGIHIGLHEDLDDARLAPRIETTTYRVVQEALTNALRHAGATSISIVLDLRDGVFSAIVEDDGAGFDSRAEPLGSRFHLGLAGMKERAVLVDGDVLIESSPGHGTIIRLEVPVP